MLKVLVFGDVVGKTGRRAIKKIMPQLKKSLRPDLVIANAENLAHGSGITRKTLLDLQSAGVDVFTSGDHVFEKPEVNEMLNDPEIKLIRPDNLLAHLPGKGEIVVNLGKKTIIVINLIGRVFIGDKMEQLNITLDNPFRTVDKILKKYQDTKNKIVLVDFHTEATSEQVAMGYYLDGRATALWGTHTHVPTADARILDNGLGFITDVGMTGGQNTVLGVSKESVIKRFVEENSEPFDRPETERAIVNALYLEINPKTCKTVKIKLIQKEIKI